MSRTRFGFFAEMDGGGIVRASTSASLKEATEDLGLDDLYWCETGEPDQDGFAEHHSAIRPEAAPAGAVIVSPAPSR